MIHYGGCLCGKVRYEVEEAPSRVGVCHCRYCQLRTGSAFGVSVYFPEDKCAKTSGELESYSYITESGNRVKIERCGNCGTSLFWRIDADTYKGMVGIAGGTFDPPTFWYDLHREVFTRTKAAFCEIDAPETHNTHPAYLPEERDDPRLRGD